MPKHPLDSFNDALTRAELRLISGLRTSAKIQEFLDSIEYSEEVRYRCPLNVVRDRKAHCFDGAVFGAGMLQRIGYPPLVVDLVPNENDDDHVLAIYKVRGNWGAVAKSNFSGLRYREPVYRSLHELVFSYFEDFFNSAGEKTLRAYTRPLDLRVFEKLDWMVHDQALDSIGEKLDGIRKYKALTGSMIRNLSYADERSVKAGLLGARKDGLFKPRKQRP
jgi:hypothetical protein